MPFRERVKRVFGRKDSMSSDGTDLGKSTSRKASNIYQPGEPMPQPKYRQPVDKKHKAHLESFSFVDNIRRKSIQSMYSPMGSRMPSRTSSCDHGLDHTRLIPGRIYPAGVGVGMLAESMNVTGNMANVGRTRLDSMDNKASEHHENVSDDDSFRQPNGTAVTAGDHVPFSEADFHKALHRATSRQQLQTLVV